MKSFKSFFKNIYKGIIIYNTLILSSNFFLNKFNLLKIFLKAFIYFDDILIL